MHVKGKFLSREHGQLPSQMRIHATIPIMTFLTAGSEQEPGMPVCTTSCSARCFTRTLAVSLPWPVKRAAWQDISTAPLPDSPQFASEEEKDRNHMLPGTSVGARLETGDVLRGLYFRKNLNGIKGNRVTMQEILHLFYLIPPPPTRSL